jgi:SPP1 gp7 family putative phage head morphogenesis protein
MMGLDSSVHESEFAELTAEDIENLPYTEAVEYLKKRDVIKKVDYNNLSDKMKFRAFTASRINDGNLLKKLNTEMIANVHDGKGLKDFLSLTKTDILDKIGMGPNQGWYWETVYRTNVQTAYNVGRAMGFEEDKPLALEFIGIDDARQTDVCHSLTGIIRPYDDPFWENHFPPLHFNCRSTVRAIYDKEELPEEWSKLNGVESPAKGFGKYPLDNDSWWNELDSQVRQAKHFGVQGEIEAAKIALGLNETGASAGGILDKSSEEQEAYAKRAYAEIRKKNAKSDIAKVANSSGLSKKEVEKVRNHLFFDKHNLEKGFARFDESAEIANAWEALEQGRATELNIMLIKHELEELTIMEKYGYDYNKAHLLADRKYPWEYKRKGGWTDDSIQADIERRLKDLL